MVLPPPTPPPESEKEDGRTGDDDDDDDDDAVPGCIKGDCPTRESNGTLEGSGRGFTFTRE